MTGEHGKSMARACQEHGKRAQAGQQDVQAELGCGRPCRAKKMRRRDFGCYYYLGDSEFL